VRGRFPAWRTKRGSQSEVTRQLPAAPPAVILVSSGPHQSRLNSNLTAFSETPSSLGMGGPHQYRPGTGVEVDRYRPRVVVDHPDEAFC